MDDNDSGGAIWFHVPPTTITVTFFRPSALLTFTQSMRQASESDFVDWSQSGGDGSHAVCPFCPPRTRCTASLGWPSILCLPSLLCSLAPDSSPSNSPLICVSSSSFPCSYLLSFIFHFFWLTPSSIPFSIWTEIQTYFFNFVCVVIPIRKVCM